MQLEDAVDAADLIRAQPFNKTLRGFHLISPISYLFNDRFREL